MDFKEIIEPLRLLFKDEVRQLGRELGLPEYLVMRQPFPGPGLAIRVIGEVTKDKLDTLRLADFIFRDEIAKAHLEGTMNQYFAVLTNMRSVGVMGDGRTYDYTLALRSVTTTDFMTADWTVFPTRCWTGSACGLSTKCPISTGLCTISRPSRPLRSSGNKQKVDMRARKPLKILTF